MTDYTDTNVSGQYRNEENRTDAHVTFRFDCEYCDEVLQTTTVEAMKNHGTTHLEAHKGTLLDVFAGKSRGKHCRNDCGYHFPVGGGEVTGFDCPNCGYDNFTEFAHRYLYWQIEYP